MNTSPCTRECPEREIGCHTRCSRYLAWKADHDKEIKRRAEQAKLDRDLRAYIYKNNRGGKRRR